MIDPNKQYRTRDGREVRIYAVDGGGDFPIHGAIYSDRGWASEGWDCDGKLYLTKASAGDLIEVKPRIKRTVWLNVYSDRGPVAHETKEMADGVGTASLRIACIPVEIDCEEGEGL